jgi:3'(2'), 5'-bisphosphate nucleotidase
MPTGIQLEEIVKLATEAGKAILDVYGREDFEEEAKGDGSPLTLADRRAHAVIETGLRELTPDIPLLSEESSREAFEKRRSWSRYWLVDPLDGTREFVRRNGEFTVNIALIDSGRSILGVVHTPVSGISHMASTEGGSFRQQPGGDPVPIRVRNLDRANIVMVASRSHAGEHVTRYRESLERLGGPVSMTSMGSSLKICLVAEGRADVYPRLGPTSEWDTAAAHCVLEAAGGRVTRIDGTPLEYNKPDILNPWFLASGDPGFDWCAAATGIEAE